MQKKAPNNYWKLRKQSFNYAFRGLAAAFASEPNIRLHTISAVLVVIAGFVLELTTLEWVAIIICIGLVFISELFNTAIEELTNLASPGRNKRAGLVKDLAAGAVIASAIISATCGLIIFINKLL